MAERGQGWRGRREKITTKKNEARARDDARPDDLAQGVLRSKAKDTRGWHALTWNNSIHFVRKRPSQP